MFGNSKEADEYPAFSVDSGFLSSQIVADDRHYVDSFTEAGAPLVVETCNGRDDPMWSTNQHDLSKTPNSEQALSSRFCDMNVSELASKSRDFKSTSRTEEDLWGPGNPWFSEYDVCPRDNDGDTHLNIAIITKNEENAIRLIDQCPSVRFLDIPNNLFQRSLHLAVLTKQPRIADRLLQSGVDLESRDKDGNTPVHMASKRGDLQMVRTLFSNSEYSGVLSKRNCLKGYKRSFNFDLRNCEGRACVHVAAENNHKDVLRFLVASGADINARELKSGRTALHEAARGGNLSMVRFLLSLPQCKVNAQAYDEVTPFDLARSHGHWNIAMELASRGGRTCEQEDDI